MPILSSSVHKINKERKDIAEKAGASTTMPDSGLGGGSEKLADRMQQAIPHRVRFARRTTGGRIPSS